MRKLFPKRDNKKRYVYDLAGVGYTRDEAAFLPAALAVQESPPSPLPGVIMYLICFIIGCVILWTIFARVDIVATADGIIVTDSRIQVVQAQEGGKVTKIQARDGRTVVKDEVLIQIDSALADSIARRAMVEFSVAELSMQRAGLVLHTLNGEDASAIAPPSGLDFAELPALVAAAKALAKSQIDEANARKRELDQEIAKRELELKRARADVTRIESAYKYAEKRELDYRELADKNFVSGHALLDRQEAKTNLVSDLKSAEARVDESIAQVSISEDLRPDHVLQRGQVIFPFPRLAVMRPFPAGMCTYDGRTLCIQKAPDGVPIFIPDHRDCRLLG
jgi:hemolysin D